MSLGQCCDTNRGNGWTSETGTFNQVEAAGGEQRIPFASHRAPFKSAFGLLIFQKLYLVTYSVFQIIKVQGRKSIHACNLFAFDLL